MHGIGWEGVAPWVPDILRNGVKGFVNEVSRRSMNTVLASSIVDTELMSIVYDCEIADPDAGD